MKNTDHPATREAVLRIDDPATRAACEAERSFLKALGAEPSTPVGALARVEPDGGLRLAGAAYSWDGAEEVRGEVSGPAHLAGELGADLADRLLEKGALDLVTPAGVPV